ncbi:MAG: sigma factor-like helix-turn-helix DNA-binding protein [Candidatus Sulfotelmatobacter sp.]
MSGGVHWIAAEFDGKDARNGQVSPQIGTDRGLDRSASDRTVGKFSSLDFSPQDLPAHNFPAGATPAPEAEPRESALDRNPDIWLYRKRTASLLRRYMRYSVETRRLPSIVGREMFRTRLTHYTVTTFEDRVIFVRDVERCLERLNQFDQQIIALVVLQDHSHERAAAILGIKRRTLERRLFEVLDELSEAFLEDGLLLRAPERGEEDRR